MRRGLDELIEASGADEIMALTNTHGLEERLDSYRALATALEVPPVATDGPSAQAQPSARNDAAAAPLTAEPVPSR